MFSKKNLNDYVDYIPWIICILFIISFLVVYVKYPFISVDEGYTRGIVNLPLEGMIYSTSWDVHPPLYYMFVMFFIEIAKVLNLNVDMVHLMKFPSLLVYFIIMLISLTKFRKEYGLLTAGIFSLTLLVMSSFFMHFLIARMYCLAILFSILGFYYVRDIYETNSLKAWILLSIFTVLGAYSHYFSAISSVVLYLMLFVWIVITRNSNFNLKDKLKNFFISVIVGVIIYIPWFIPLVNQLHEVHEYYWIQQVTVDSLIEFFSYYFTMSNNFYIRILAIILLAAILLKFSFDFYKSRSNDDLYLITGIMVFVGTIVISSIISFTFKPILYARYLLPAAAVAWFCISIAIGKIESKKVILAIILLITVVGMFNVLHEVDYITSDYDTTLKEAAVLEKINNNDSIVIFFNDNNYLRTYPYLDNVYAKYGSFHKEDWTKSLRYDNFEGVNYTTFNIPDDLDNFKDKNVYWMVFYKTPVNTDNYTMTHIGTAQHADIYNVTR